MPQDGVVLLDLPSCGLTDAMKMRRAFADLDYGQVHYWHGGPVGAKAVPLFVIHPGPGTARCQIPLLERLAETRQVYAPDIMGMGDSDPLPNERPEIPDFAVAMLKFADACGLERFDMFGSSLGARIAIEITLAAPARVRKLVMNRVVDTAGPMLDEMKAHHAPKVEPDASGSHVLFVWSRLCDTYRYFPWFKRNAANQRKGDMPSADKLHTAFIEHIKMCTTSYRAFDAGWRYPLADKLPRIAMPTLARADTAGVIPGAQAWEPPLAGEPLVAKPADLDAISTEIERFLAR